MKKGRSQAVKEDVNRKKAKLDSQAPLAMPSFAAPSVEQTATGGTMGLLTVEEFRQKRESMVREAAAEKQKLDVREKKEKQRANKTARARMSFAEDEDQDEDQDEKNREAGGGNSVRSVGKDPTVETSFLPDAKREEGLVVGN